MITEAAKLLADNVADSPDAIDLAMVLGTGFAPFRGGPIQWARSIGIAETFNHPPPPHP
jgi:3-hydroxyacyl-CoA dehydrogenase/enoyl-CoA hydratase/3-hydroxybutyryl-CoA epimerase